MIFKVDFEKAFDSMKWDYLIDSLKAFGFGQKWCNWIKGCLETAMGSILVNGLKSNLQKSKLLGIGVNSNEVERAASTVGCSMFTSPFKYLGVKVGGNMSRIDSWDEVITKVSTCLSKWKIKTLSIGGRLTLLKSVLTSIPLYHMSIFKVPMGVLKKLETIRRNFFNGVDQADKSITWIGLEKVLASKKNGGLGVPSFFASNRALLFKWVWRFLTQESSLWSRFIKAINAKGINLTQFIRKKVGNGVKSLFWEECWVGEIAFKSLVPRLFALEESKSISVADKLNHPSLVHSFRRLPRGGAEEDQLAMLCSCLDNVILSNMDDRWCWNLNASGSFSVESTRSYIDDLMLPNLNVPARWVKVVPIKVNIHAWKVCLDKLPTRLNLSIRGIDIPSILCPICNSYVESSSRIFFSCSLARKLRSKFFDGGKLKILQSMIIANGSTGLSTSVCLNI
ncbi:RNA-directed DNA polymerase, eukaryota, reverse transcriptase zinc-binding domain protein [Tanacetum coccineum]